MKMVKSLLLGSAAGLVAVSAGQAADLPVKAKPVEYVKVCSLYGAGFYYMPGTDMCIKVGGYARFEAVWAPGGNFTWGDFNGTSNVRSTSNFAYRARGYITVDAREQTAYGTARGYLAIGLSTNDLGINTAANQFSANRAFIQWAGFTGGITQSFYDFYSAAATAYLAGYIPTSDTGDSGWTVFGYTAQLGNGFSATLSAETRRMTQIINVDPADIVGFNTILAPFPGGTTGFELVSTATTVGSLGSLAPGCYQAGNNMSGFGSNSTDCGLFPGSGAYGGFQSPDIVGNIRLDQTWGSAQVMGALHELNAQAYGISATGTYNVNTGHPGDDWGWVVGGGLRLNFPMIAQGDYFDSQVSYTQGALRYLFQTPNTNWGAAYGVDQAYGVLSDAVYGSTIGSFGVSTVTGHGPVPTDGSINSLQLTTGWGVNLHYEHYWTPAWHEAFYGGYTAVDYNGTANNALCALENNTAAASITATIAGCNNNWSEWYAGSRLQWDVTKSFYMGVDVLYQRLNTATINSSGSFVSATQTGGGQSMAITGSSVPAALAGVNTSENAWSVRFRMHKDFLP
jgi:Porin subfamily